MSNEVAVCAAQSLVELAEASGLGVLLDTVGLTADTLASQRRIDWAVYVRLVEQFVERAGGTDAAAALTEDLHLRGGVVDWLLSSRFAPRHLYTQALTLAPRAWRNLETVVTPAGEGLRVQARLTDGVGCASFFALSRSSLERLPVHAGLARAEVVVEDLTARGACWRVRSQHNPKANVELEPTLLPPTGTPPAPKPIPRRATADERAAAACLAWKLTPTETLVLIEVLTGASNKDVGVELGMVEATVETHMTNIFRKSKIRGRTSLVSQVWSTRW